MKNVLLICLVGLMFLTSCEMAFGVDLRQNVVVRYKFDDNEQKNTVLDSSGNMYNGVFVDANTADVNVEGKINGALSFDGTQYIDTNRSFGQELFSDSFSFNVWAFLSDSLVDTEFGLFGLAGDEGGQPNQVSCSVFEDEGAVYLYFSYQANGGVDAYVYIITNFETEHWHMLTATVTKLSEDTMKISLYLNSVLMAEESFEDVQMASFAPFTYPNVPLYIGAYNYWGSVIGYMEGYLDDVIFFNKFLSQEEIDFLYNDGNGRSELYDPPPVKRFLGRRQ